MAKLPATKSEVSINPSKAVPSKIVSTYIQELFCPLRLWASVKICASLCSQVESIILDRLIIGSSQAVGGDTLIGGRMNLHFM